MKIEKTTLKNGLKILLIPMKNTQTVTAMTLVGVGSEYESKKEQGLAHFLEHMCFKGTVKRPTAQAITYELDCIGADYNAYTGGIYTGYYAKAHKKHVKKILDVISDIYLNSIFPEKEISKEKDVVIQEINMREDNPQSKVLEVLDELLYGDQPAGRAITGTKESVSSFTRDNLDQFHKKNYVPGSTTVIISGSFSPIAIRKEIENLFGGMKKTQATPKQKITSSQKKPAVKIHYKETNQTHIYIAFRAFDLFDKRVEAAHTLGTVLSGGMSSRLFTKIREEMGLCYYVQGKFGPGIDDGLFTVRAGVGNDKVEAAIVAILAELKKIKEEMIDEKELRKVKDYRLSDLVLGLETSSDFAEYYGFQELMKEKLKTPEDASKLIEKVTAKQVQTVAEDIFKTEGLNLAVVGPHKDEKVLLKLLNI